MHHYASGSKGKNELLAAGVAEGWGQGIDRNFGVFLRRFSARNVIANVAIATDESVVSLEQSGWQFRARPFPHEIIVSHRHPP